MRTRTAVKIYSQSARYRHFESDYNPKYTKRQLKKAIRNLFRDFLRDDLIRLINDMHK